MGRGSEDPQGLYISTVQTWPGKDITRVRPHERRCIVFSIDRHPGQKDLPLRQFAEQQNGLQRNRCSQTWWDGRGPVPDQGGGNLEKQADLEGVY